MFVLHFLPHMDYLLEAAIDSTSLVILVAPTLYFFLVQPMAVHISERERVEEMLVRNEEEQFKAMLKTSLDGFWIVDMQGQFLEVNDAYCQLIGYRREELLHMAVPDVEAKETSADVGRHIDRIMETGSDRFETKHRRKDGRILDIEVSANYSSIHNGRLYCFLRDITERKQAEDALRIAAITFESQEAIMITDARANILRVNQSFQEVTGYTEEEVIGKNPSIMQSGRHDDNFYLNMWLELLQTGKWSGEIWDKRKNGEIYPKSITITAVADSSMRVANYVAVFHDITQQKQSEEEIHHLAFYDALTQLPNRRMLMNRLNQALSSSMRKKEHGALLFIDLDNFKTLNDTKGHDVGDLLLIEVATRLRQCVREEDTVARLGGDEFVLILEQLSAKHTAAAAHAECIAAKIRAELGQSYHLNGVEHFSSPSIGISLFCESASSADELLKQADAAMYRAKHAGRDTVCFYDPGIQTELEARLELAGALRTAIARQQLALYYQVQVDESNQPIGAEALLRWHHPELGMVSPTQFIPLAEESGLIVHIGQWVLESACAQLKAWEASPRTRSLVLSVNISGRQFREAGFVAHLHDLIAQTGINPNLLKLEITESMLLHDVDDVIKIMKQLKKLGVCFSMDDFGTGYSSLSAIKSLPLDQLKIDQAFVRDLDVNASDKAIVRTIIAMAQSLNLDAIAEGVETEQQRQILLNKGCTSFQGFLFGKPVPIDQFEASLPRKQSKTAAPPLQSAAIA